jgi:hypothetical protein
LCRRNNGEGQGLAAADFFTVEVLTIRGLVRYVVFFVMKLKTRTVEFAGITSEPDGAWMAQLARNVTDASDGFLRGVQYIILDRDPLYTAAFRGLLRDSSVKPVVLPAWSPNLNAFAERFVETAKSECLERMVLLGEAPWVEFLHRTRSIASSNTIVVFIDDGFTRVPTSSFRPRGLSRRAGRSRSGGAGRAGRAGGDAHWLR